MFNIDLVVFLSFISGLLYLGPESIMPLASIIAAIVGVILILWRYIISFIKKVTKFLYYKITRKPIPQPIVLDLDSDDDAVQEMPTEQKS